MLDTVPLYQAPRNSAGTVVRGVLPFPPLLPLLPSLPLPALVGDLQPPNKRTAVSSKPERVAALPKEFFFCIFMLDAPLT